VKFRGEYTGLNYLTAAVTYNLQAKHAPFLLPMTIESMVIDYGHRL